MKRNDELLRRVRRAYEHGRGLRALRTSALVVPMVLLSFGGCGTPAFSVALGVVLATLAAVLVWRGGSAGRAVAPGLVAGLAPLVIPIVACPMLDYTGHALPLAACVAGGLVSGAVITHRAMREVDGRVAFVLVGGVIATLAGALGCVAAGYGGVAAMIAGLVVVAPLGLRPARVTG